MNQNAADVAGLGIITGKKSRIMLNSHCNNNDKKENKLKKICETKYAEKCMRPPGRELTICGLVDITLRNPLQVWKTISYMKQIVYR